MLTSTRLIQRCLPALLGLAVWATPVLGQAMPGADAGAQSLRAYRFLFLAYAVAWVLVFGWVVSITRKVSRLARRLED